MLALLIAGCSELGEPLERGSSTLDETINGRSLWYPPGGTFAIVLEEEADAGFVWEYALSDSTVIRVDSVTYKKYTPLPPPVPVGGSATKTIHFSATRRGQCEVYLYEHQPWMKNVPPWRVVRFSVFVQT
jgi:predicted secreted protein